MSDEHEDMMGEDPARYDRTAHWPHIERRRPGYDRRQNVHSQNIEQLDRRCAFCESALKVVGGVMAIMMLAILGMGIWAWNLQENIWRQILENRAVILNDRFETRQEDKDIIASVELNRAVNEKNYAAIIDAIQECVPKNRR